MTLNLLRTEGKEGFRMSMELKLLDSLQAPVRYECTRTATKEAPAERSLLLTRWCRCGCRSAESEETGRSAGNPRMLDGFSGQLNIENL